MCKSFIFLGVLFILLIFLFIVCFRKSQKATLQYSIGNNVSPSREFVERTKNEFQNQNQKYDGDQGWLESVFSKFVSGKPKPERPTFVLLYGPPGSGKSYTLNQTLLKEHLKRETFVEVNVDDIVSIHPDYQQLLKRCNQNNQCRVDVYQKIRKFADVVSTSLFEFAVERKLNIQMETTGRSIEWICNNFMPKLTNYYKILIYPLANEKTLIDRVDERSKVSDRQLSTDNFKEVYIAPAQKNFKTLSSVFDKTVIYNGNINPPCVSKTIENQTETCNKSCLVPQNSIFENTFEQFVKC